MVGNGSYGPTLVLAVINEFSLLLFGCIRVEIQQSPFVDVGIHYNESQLVGVEIAFSIVIGVVLGECDVIVAYVILIVIVYRLTIDPFI